MVKTRLTNHFREMWINSARHSHKGLEYLELSRFDCEIKPYLNFILRDRSIIKMLKMRTGNHILSVEIDRYNNRKLYEERLCTLCNLRKIQDLYHVMVECPKFNETRKSELSKLIKFDKAEFYSFLNNINQKDLAVVAKFMDTIEETIKERLIK